MPNIEKFTYIQYNPQVIAYVGKILAENYPKLKSFGFITHRFHCSEGYNLNGDFNILQIFDFLENLRHLNELELGADFNCKNIAKLLNFTPRLKTLSIYQIDFLCLITEEMNDIMTHIKKIISRRFGLESDNRINLIVNEKQCGVLKGIENAEYYVNITIKHRKISLIHYEV